jgi:PPOX class probable F420-dependent enzyme
VTDPFETHSGAIPELYWDILENQSFGHVATLNPEETIHNTPVWVDHDRGEAVLINTLSGRRKEQNLRQHPTATISIADPENPYRYLSVRGETMLIEEGAADHIDELAQQYLDADRYPHHEEEDAPRVKVRIAADHVITRGRSADR